MRHARYSVAIHPMPVCLRAAFPVCIRTYVRTYVHTNIRTYGRALAHAHIAGSVQRATAQVTATAAAKHCDARRGLPWVLTWVSGYSHGVLWVLTGNGNCGCRPLRGAHAADRRRASERLRRGAQLCARVRDRTLRAQHQRICLLAVSQYTSKAATVWRSACAAALRHTAPTSAGAIPDARETCRAERRKRNGLHCVALVQQRIALRCVGAATDCVALRLRRNGFVAFAPQRIALRCVGAATDCVVLRLRSRSGSSSGSPRYNRSMQPRIMRRGAPPAACNWQCATCNRHCVETYMSLPV
jgi:hypothetical protein